MKAYVLQLSNKLLQLQLLMLWNPSYEMTFQSSFCQYRPFSSWLLAYRCLYDQMHSRVVLVDGALGRIRILIKEHPMYLFTLLLDLAIIWLKI